MPRHPTPGTTPVRSKAWLRQQIVAAASAFVAKSTFDLDNKSFIACSRKIERLTHQSGDSLPLPSHALPPLP